MNTPKPHKACTYVEVCKASSADAYRRGGLVGTKWMRAAACADALDDQRPRTLGYALPLDDEEAEAARTALALAGAEEIFIEQPGYWSANDGCPPAYVDCMSRVKAGDRLIIYRMSDALPCAGLSTFAAAYFLIAEVGVELQVLRGEGAGLSENDLLKTLEAGMGIFARIGKANSAMIEAHNQLRNIPGSVGLAAQLPLPKLAAVLAAERRSRELAKTNGPHRKIDLRGMPPPSLQR
jgi:hypothetical protein